MSHGILPSEPTSQARSILIILLSAALMQASCAARSGYDAAEAEPLLEFENAWTSPVHVFAMVGETLLRVGWAGPSSTTRLQLPVPPFASLRLVVVPTERLAAFRNYDRSGAYAGEPYTRDIALAHRWRFSGNSLMAVPLPSRIGRP
jgi:hypothetical protein